MSKRLNVPAGDYQRSSQSTLPLQKAIERCESDDKSYMCNIPVLAEQLKEQNPTDRELLFRLFALRYKQAKFKKYFWVKVADIVQHPQLSLDFKDVDIFNTELHKRIYLIPEDFMPYGDDETIFDEEALGAVYMCLDITKLGEGAKIYFDMLDQSQVQFDFDQYAQNNQLDDAGLIDFALRDFDVSTLKSMNAELVLSETDTSWWRALTGEAIVPFGRENQFYSYNAMHSFNVQYELAERAFVVPIDGIVDALDLQRRLQSAFQLDNSPPRVQKTEEILLRTSQLQKAASLSMHVARGNVAAAKVGRNADCPRWPALLPERRLQQRYVLLDSQPLGSGSFGEVWKARDRKYNSVVAIKRLAVLRDPAKRRERDDVCREVQVLMRATDDGGRCLPNVVCYKSHFRAAWIDGKMDFFIVMEHVDGETMREFGRRSMLANGRTGIEPSAALSLAMSLFSGLAQLHTRGIAHRDVKPSNVMVESSTTNNGPKAVLVDLGLACFQQAQCNAFGGGTVTYYAPERFAFAPSETLAQLQAADVFAAAAALRDTFYGGQQPLFTREFAKKLLKSPAQVQKFFQGWTPPADVYPHNALLNEALRRAMHVDSAQRPTAQQMVEELSKMKQQALLWTK